MCGIAGFYGFRNDDLIKKFSKELAHRGPDGEGFYIDDRVTLLNRRLAIIDRKGGNQPIYNEDKSIVVSYNGEIYNYRELRKILEKDGHVFSTHSDTEVIVHGYEQWGESCFDRFNGMFGVALYDIKKEKLILARDHFGIKPLYYAVVGPASAVFPPDVTSGRYREPSRFATHNTRLIFSSEIKPIINSGLVTKRPNDRIIYRYLKYRVHDDQKETFFEGIYKLMPGEMMILSQKSKVKSQKFSNLEEDLKKLSQRPNMNRVSSKKIETFRKKLIEAIRLRLISEVPVGTCLSGGLDSSIVVAIVNKLLKEKVKEAASVGKIQKTFSAVFPGQSNDEEKYVDEVIKFINLESYKVKPTPEEFFDEIQDFIRTQEEPTISTGPYAQFKVMRLAHKYVTVVLDGQGSDEIMAGYLPYYFVFLKQLFRQRKFISLFREAVGSVDILYKYSINRLIEVLGIKQSLDINSILNSAFTTKYRKEKFQPTEDDLKKRLVEDIFYNSLPSLLRYEDKNAMRFSIEGRVPFLDFNLLKYLFNLEDDAIIKNGWNKFILRQATKTVLPDVINKRRNKIGFTTPEYDWFMRMKNRIYSIFLSESFAKRKYFNQPEVLKAFQKFIEGKVDDTMVFWRLLNLELWLREFFSPPSHKAMAGETRKKIEIKADGKTYFRYPIRTDLFKKEDNYVDKISKITVQSFKRLDKETKWLVVVSEKIVAIAQGRSYFIWDIKPGIWARILSNFVTKTPYGIGLGSPWTMQLAINEIGLPRILFASFVSLITKPLAIKGLFYRLVGPEVASIDGPTEYSLYPSNVSAKLGPKNPQQVAEKIDHEIRNLKLEIRNFLGVVIIDANDLGQKVLGNSTNLDDRLIEKIFRDNPMGQADEQTPIVLVVGR